MHICQHLRKQGCDRFSLHGLKWRQKPEPSAELKRRQHNSCSFPASCFSNDHKRTQLVAAIRIYMTQGSFYSSELAASYYQKCYLCHPCTGNDMLENYMCGGLSAIKKLFRGGKKLSFVSDIIKMHTFVISTTSTVSIVQSPGMLWKLGSIWCQCSTLPLV